MFLFPSSGPTDITRASLRKTSQPCWGITSLHLRLVRIRSSPNVTQRINMDSNRIHAGPLNKNISPLLEYTSTTCIVPALPAYYTGGLYYFVRLRLYDFLSRPWNQMLRAYVLRLALKCRSQHISVSCSADCSVLTSATKQQQKNFISRFPTISIFLVCDSPRKVNTQSLF
jgi:hypothetical protein